jgi:hypothetical protein
LSRELWGALGALRSVLLVAAALAGQLDVGLMLIFAIVVSFRIEDLVTRRFVLAGGDVEVVLIGSKRRWLRDRPDEIVDHFPPETVERTTMGMFFDRWQIHDQTLRIGRRHRSTIEAWLHRHTGQSAAKSASTTQNPR